MRLPGTDHVKGGMKSTRNTEASMNDKRSSDVVRSIDVRRRRGSRRRHRRPDTARVVRQICGAEVHMWMCVRRERFRETRDGERDGAPERRGGRRCVRGMWWPRWQRRCRVGRKGGCCTSCVMTWDSVRVSTFFAFLLFFFLFSGCLFKLFFSPRRTTCSRV